MPAESNEEIFEVVDEHNDVVGRQPRGVCHAQGLPHRAAYCFVFNTDGHLLLQQRSERKKIGANQWDLSIAEHLQPGEAYSEAVVRGLSEELGISVSSSDLRGPLAPPHLRTLHIPGVVEDVEFVQAFRLDDWSGRIEIDPTEVQAIRWVALDDVYTAVQKVPHEFTSWLRGELELLRGSLQIVAAKQEMELQTMAEGAALQLA